MSRLGQAPPLETLTLWDLLKLGREVWGKEYRQPLHEITENIMVGLGDLARISRDSRGQSAAGRLAKRDELAKELGNLIFSTVRWCDDLHLDPVECVRLAYEAQRRYAESGRPR